VINAAASTTPAVAIDPVKAKQLEKLKGAAQAFEAVFLRQMISSMRSASLGDDILGSDASNQFRDMADANTANDMAKRGTIGVADMLLKQFTPRVLGGAPATMPPMKKEAE
jgi:Rod binding protein